MTIPKFMAISIGLKLKNEEKDKLFRVTFPELLLLNEMLNDHMNIIRANISLYDNGLPLLKKKKKRKKKTTKSK